MDDSVQKSCWGITAWAVVAFGCVLALALMFGASETTNVIAAAG